MPRRCKLSFITAILRSAAQPSPAAYHFLYRTDDVVVVLLCMRCLDQDWECLSSSSFEVFNLP